MIREMAVLFVLVDGGIIFMVALGLVSVAVALATTIGGFGMFIGLSYWIVSRRAS